MNVLIGIVIILHGLVHLWYVTLSQGLVAFKPQMGWTGRSWLLTNILGDSATHNLATIFYLASTVLFLIAGAGLLASQSWSRVWLIVAAGVSMASIVLFWDGSFRLSVEKGAFGLLINGIILFAILVLKWPSA